MNENFKSGFVAIIGRARNVGKSTLMNHLIGQKIAITSNKAPDYKKQDPDRIYHVIRDKSYSWTRLVSIRPKINWESIWLRGRTYPERGRCHYVAGRTHHLHRSRRKAYC